MIFQLQSGFLSLTFRDFRLLHCVCLRVLRFVFEQAYRVTNGMSDFLMGKDVVELEPSLCFVVQLGKSDSGGSDFLEDVVDHSDFLWSASCIPVWLEISTDYSSKVSVTFVVRENVSTSAEDVCGSRREVERKDHEGRHLVLFGFEEEGIVGSVAHDVVFYCLHLKFMRTFCELEGLVSFANLN